jgi:hypothetical protein
VRAAPLHAIDAIQRCAGVVPAMARKLQTATGDP